MPQIVRQGSSIVYDVTGEGPPVLLGHGLLFDRRMWEAVAPLLNKQYMLINIDARGHGRSTAAGPFSLEDLAGDWLAIMDQEKIERAALCGLSVGGMTAMRIALQAPERVASMVLLDASADPEPTWGAIKYKAMAAIARRFGYLRAFEGTIKKLMFGRTSLTTRKELVEREAGRMRGQDMKAIYHGVRAVSDRTDIHGRLGDIRARSLVLVGEEDLATPRVRAERIAAGIRGARLVAIPGAGHISALEAPERVAEQIRNFLDEERK